MYYRFSVLFDFPHLAEFFSPRVVPAPDWPVKRFCKTTKGAEKNKLEGNGFCIQKKVQRKLD